MTRTEWLITLETELTRLGVPAPREIVSDYEEHFAAGAESKKTDEEIAAKLGDPKAVARAHQAESLVDKAAAPQNRPADLGHVWKASLRLLLLTPFTFLMLIGPFFFLSVFLVGGWGLAFLFGGLGAAGLAIASLGVPLLLVDFWSAGAFIFGTLAFAGAAALGLMTMWVVTKIILQAFVSYLRWNVNFVLEKGA